MLFEWYRLWFGLGAHLFTRIALTSNIKEIVMNTADDIIFFLPKCTRFIKKTFLFKQKIAIDMNSTLLFSSSSGAFHEISLVCCLHSHELIQFVNAFSMVSTKKCSISHRAAATGYEYKPNTLKITSHL